VSDVKPEYLSLKQLATYSGLSKNTLRGYIEDEPAVALPCHRVGGKIMVRVRDFDAWMQGRRAVGKPKLIENLRELGLDGLLPA
jgi:hypothetical protein